ncbi:MAG: reverse transcriptase domain-containing protein [Phycisphaerae bacterium]|nr:reverse transcriptase domain-containing protein [Phycisphaerae bacterium]
MKLDFGKALKKIVIEDLKGNNPIPDILGFLHLKVLLKPDFNSKLNKILDDYLKDKYRPKPQLTIDVPKANFTIRPMARPVTEDWIIYEAIIEYLSKRILKKDKKICGRSCSILNFKEDGLSTRDAWLKFDKHSWNFYEKGYEFAVTTDITGYYENISIDELRRRIIDYLGQDNDGKKLNQVIVNQLKNWSDERISGYGLPQGPPGSSFLADIFLDSVDRAMEKYRGYFRYMDDIRIFCKDAIEAKLALKELTIALRALKLNINAKKTDILQEREIEENLFDPQKSLMNVIEKSIKSGNQRIIKEIVPELLKLVEIAFLEDPFEKRHLNFGLYRLGVLYNSGFQFNKERIIGKIEKNFVSKPHHTGLFCDFLSMFPDDENVPKFLIKFLKSPDNIYEGQELKVLRSLLRFNFQSSRQDVDFFLKSAQDSNKHYAIRAFYFMLLGKHGNNRDRNLIIECYNSLSEVYTKITVILSVQELGLPNRNDFYARVKRKESNNDINEFIDYVKSLSKPTYFLTVERPRIKTYEEYEGNFY